MGCGASTAGHSRPPTKDVALDAPTPTDLGSSVCGTPAKYVASEGQSWRLSVSENPTTAAKYEHSGADELRTSLGESPRAAGPVNRAAMLKSMLRELQQPFGDATEEERKLVDELGRTLRGLQPKDEMTDLVQRRWAEAAADMDAFAAAFRVRVLEHPNLVKTYYSHSDLDTLPRRVLSAIGHAILLMDETHHFISTVQELGVRHSAYGVRGHEYEEFETIVLAALKDRLEESYDNKFEKAFRKVFASIRSVMEQGARSAEGQAVARRRLQSRMELVSSSWNIVRAAERNASESFLQSWYNMARGTQGATFSEKLGEFTARKGLVMKTITEVVTNRVNHPDKVESMLRALGSRHITYETEDTDYPKMGESFFAALAKWLPDGLDGELLEAWQECWNYMADIMMDGASAGLNSFENVNAPRETPLALVFTDIESSTALWGKDRDLMQAAVEQHHRILRQVVGDLNGYEVKTVGDAFMFAFKTVDGAVAAALEMQLRLHRADWGAFNLMKMGVRTRGTGADELWGNGLRVRIGVHLCHEIVPTYDPIHQRYDYYGPDVNVASRVESAAAGGQVLLTTATRDAVQRRRSLGGDLLQQQPLTKVPSDSKLSYATKRRGSAAGAGAAVRPGSRGSQGDATSLAKELLLPGRAEWKVVATGVYLKGVSIPVALVSVLPTDLAGREFPAIAASEVPH